MINVTKRNGKKEPLDLDKIHQMLFFACEGLTNVSVSAIEHRAKLQFFEGINTSLIHDILITAASELISEEYPNYQFVAGRLINYSLRKNVYGSYDPIKFSAHVQDLVQRGIYDKEVLEKYTLMEIEELGKYVKHKRDEKFTFVAMKQWEGKYLCQNRATKQIYETPQMAYMMIAAIIFMNYTENRLEYVKRFYDAVSNFDISLPTPIMSGLRTNTRQFSSCVVLNVGDSLDSIAAADHAVLRYISRKAGLGINFGRIRGLGAEIRGGDAVHTGLIPFLAATAKKVKSCSQGGVRGGAATVHFPMWHFEFEDLVVLKNNKGTENNRVRQLDYSFQINSFLYQRLIDEKDISFFSPSDVPGLYEAFFADQRLFAILYEKYEADSSIRRRTMSALDAFSALMTERAETGRIYIQHVDLVNTHSPFKPEVAPIEQSNLCVSGNTNILTDVGYIRIGDYVDETVSVWNGTEFSTVQIKKTGINQELMTVVTDSGQELECTPYHKFYIQTDYKGTIVEVRAKDLTVGDKLIKLETPVIEGSEELRHAYENGFYSGDGCYTKNKQRIYLYGAKRSLKDQFNLGSQHWVVSDSYDRDYIETTELKDKYFVPSCNYTIESRLKWLAGIADSDGHVQRNGLNESMFISSTQRVFLQEIQLMLQTLGVQSKVKQYFDGGDYSMPDGKGSHAVYKTNPAWCLQVPSSELYKLMTLGFEPARLKIETRLTQRAAGQFVKIKEVHSNTSIEDTYCFNEELKHMGVFNGILTGQCQEIALPSSPFNDVNQGEDGLISLCTLSAINWGNFDNPEDMEGACELSVRALDALLDYQDYPVGHAERATRAYRPVGVGIINLAYFLAKRGLRYDSGALETVNEWTEAWSYYLLKTSVQLAKEQGRCEMYENLKYADGILPIDTYKKSIDELVSTELKMPWEELRADIAKYGIRNATTMALMPAETSAQISNSTNGIEMPRALVSVKVSKDGILKQVVPEIGKLKNKYSLLWEQESNLGYIQICGVLQKYIDQSISANTSYNPENFPESKLPMSMLLKDMMLAYKYGLKNLYYHNTYDGSGEQDVSEKDTPKGGIVITLPPLEDDDEPCEGCTI